MRLNIKLSPDQERQLLETSMVPNSDDKDHILIIETGSAMLAPVVAQQLMPSPAVLSSSSPGEGRKTSFAPCVSDHMVIALF